MAEVSPSGRNTFPIFEASHVFPVTFGVSEGRPAVALALLQEFFHGSTNRSSKQENASDRIIELDGLFLVFEAFQEICCLPVSSIFGVVSVEVADTVSCLKVTGPSQILLNWFFGCSVRLLRHD